MWDGTFLKMLLISNFFRNNVMVGSAFTKVPDKPATLVKNWLSLSLARSRYLAIYLSIYLSIYIWNFVHRCMPKTLLIGEGIKANIKQYCSNLRKRANLLNYTFNSFLSMDDSRNSLLKWNIKRIEVIIMNN